MAGSSNERIQKMATATKSKSSSSSVKPRTKSQIVGAIADETGLTRKEVQGVFDSMAGMIKKDLGKKAPASSPFPA
jgi:hypothetical protein